MISHYTHGGDLIRLARESGRNPEGILDFSVNVRPEGLPGFLKEAFITSLNILSPYPSPDAEDARAALAKACGVPEECLILGNGSNELIHALPRSLRLSSALIAEPAFTEYRLACERAGTFVTSLTGNKENGFLPDQMELRQQAAQGEAVFLANPTNPAGTLWEKDNLLTLVRDMPDVLWIVDEAFIDYVGEEFSLLKEASERPNLIVLRSLTKFYGMAGVRAGYASGCPALINRLKEALPPWNLNTFAIEAIKSIAKNRVNFPPASEEKSFIAQNRTTNGRNRDDLWNKLCRIKGITPRPSAANYILFQWPHAPRDLARRLVREHGIALRDCSNYTGLEEGGWYRAAVRTPEDHQRLATALETYAQTDHSPENRTDLPASEAKASPSAEFPALIARKHKPALMLQGTCSDAGKSVLTAAFCRILLQDGYDVAPFKAQNMALNSGVTAPGGEMGRAQMVQAEACRLDPDARMNPVLLKPHSEKGAQVIVLGHATGNQEAREYFTSKRKLWPIVQNAYDSLAAEHEVMVLEGAGSPGEINLKSADIVNMNMARHARASVLLTGDIDRGGVYASFLGTWMTFTREEKSLLSGFLVNKFRGDASLLGPAHDYMLQRTGIPVVGTIPMIRALNIPEEDRVTFSFDTGTTVPPDNVLNIAVIIPGHVSNYTDFAPLAAEPDISVRAIRTPEEFGTPDLVILPGSKSVIRDLEVIKASGLAELVKQHAMSGKWTLGICGGLQMLGKKIEDPDQVESAQQDYPALGILDLVTSFAKDKVLVHIDKAQTPLNFTTSGYEIHHGRTRAGDSCQSLFYRPDGSVCGYGTGKVWATYLHGLFDKDEFRRSFIDMVRKDAGLEPAGKILARYDLDGALNRLADIVRENVDLKRIYRSMGL